MVVVRAPLRHRARGATVRACAPSPSPPPPPSPSSPPRAGAELEAAKRRVVSACADAGEREVSRSIAALLALGGEEAPRRARLSGDWLLLKSYKPAVPLRELRALPGEAPAGGGAEAEDDTSITSLASWKRYIFDGGPSPLQKLVTGSGGGSSSVRVYQRLILPEEEEDAGGAPPPPKKGSFLNVVDFADGALVLEALVEPRAEGEGGGERRVYFRFSKGTFLLKPPGPVRALVSSVAGGGGAMGPLVRLPYPVPFTLLSQVLPDETLGFLDSLYVDDTLRISVGNRGSAFVLLRRTDDDGGAGEEAESLRRVRAFLEEYS